MEPQWNPTVEEQALARVHRMGQTKQVTTVRYVMQGSFEEVCDLLLLNLYKFSLSTAGRGDSAQKERTG